MPEHLESSLLGLRARVAQFAGQELTPIERALDGGAAPSELREQVIAASRAVGLFGMTQPRSVGGTEAGPLAMTVAREALAAVNLRVGRYVFGPRPGVLAAAEGRLRTDYLEPMLRGEKRGSFGFTEPDSAARATWAVQAGDELIVTGRKSFVTGAAEADFVSALVNVEKAESGIGGTAMVVIDTHAPGVVLEPPFRTLEGGHHVAIRFEGVRVPRWRVVGKLGEGMPRALDNISTVRLGLLAHACGMMQWAIEYVTNYICAPHRSGVPLGNREGVRLRYADLRIEAYAARSMLYRTARLAESDVNDVNEVMATKVFSTEVAGRVIDTAVQLVGGNALSEGHPLERLYREVRSLRFTEGASDVLRLNIAKGRLELGKGSL